MIRCYITDRKPLGGVEALLRNAKAVRADWIQVREKDLSARELTGLVQQLLSLGPKIIVNSRADVAHAAGAHGLHLPANSIPPHQWRALTRPGFLIGVSCHSIADVVRAADEGADYTLLSPIFPSNSKPGYGPPLGIEALREASKRVKIPILALGGVSHSNIHLCLNAGAAGFAAISTFQT